MFRNTLILILPVVAFLVLSSTFNANAGFFIVVPTANGGAEGINDNGFPFNCGSFSLTSQRYQQLYASSQFFSLSCFITEIKFRQDGPEGTTFGPTIIPNTTIELSTSEHDVSNMSATFASNIGGDVVTVFSGDLTLSSSIVCGAGPCNPFDIGIQLQQGFPYDPSKGDLLLDVRIPQCVVTSQQDAVSSSSVVGRAVVNDDINATDADFVTSSSGLVTVFICGEPPPTPTPEPTGACCTGENNETCTPDVIECGCVGEFFQDTSCEPNPCIEPPPLTPTPTPEPTPPPPVQTIIIPTMGQWGMIIATILLGFFAIRMLRNRKDSEI